MKVFHLHQNRDRDSRLPKLAAQDWEYLEAKAAALEAAEKRQKSLQQALDFAPRFELHRLPLNFWAVHFITPNQGTLSPNGGDAEGRGGYLSPNGGDVAQRQRGLPHEITGCTDLHPIGNQVLFFRSNLSEEEIRDNIDLSFLPF